MPIYFKKDVDHPGLKYRKAAKKLFEKWHPSENIGLTIKWSEKKFKKSVVLKSCQIG